MDSILIFVTTFVSVLFIEVEVSAIANRKVFLSVFQPA